MDLNEDTFGTLINIAGRQRMLSQRIGFLLLTLSGQLENGEERSQTLWDMLEIALSDFKSGVDLLLEGDAEFGIPKLTSPNILAVLRDGGQADIDRFLADVQANMALIGRGELPDPETFKTFNDFILTGLLQTLQALVVALEKDFGNEMQSRRAQREADAKRVMSALEEIQKASKFSRMIALNAKISADRAGPYGQEFGALTEELKNISMAITDSSEDILRHLENI